MRAHLYEFGHIAPQGIRYLSRLERFVEDENAKLPDLVREICRDLLDQIYQLTGRIDVLKKKKIDGYRGIAEASRRLQIMPRVGPIAALAIETFTPPTETFKCGRDFAAWLGLVPLQKSTGGKQRLGKTWKMANAIFDGHSSSAPWLWSDGHPGRARPGGSWLARMMAKKPRILVAIALANKMARGIWAMLTKEEDYRNPATVPA